jgi:hypothetical protein
MKKKKKKKKVKPQNEAKKAVPKFQPARLECGEAMRARQQRRCIPGVT